MINKKFGSQIKAILPVLVISLYWCWQLHKFLKLENRIPQSLNEVIFYSCLEAICALAIVGLLLKACYNDKLSNYLSSDSYKSLFKKGLAWGIISFVLINFIFSPIGQILSQVFQISDIKKLQSPDTSFFFKSNFSVVYWLFISIIGGGIAEETIRFFSLNFFERDFGKKGLILSIVISSTFFGLGHIYQGTSSSIAHFFSGLLWSYLYIRERSLVVNILTHGLFDLIGSAIASYLYQGR